jgi:hypothetical protein
MGEYALRGRHAMNHLDNLLRDWGHFNKFRAKLSIRTRGYRLVSMPDVLPAVNSLEELTQHENGAIYWLEPRQSLHNLKPPIVALGEHSEYVVDYYKREFAPRVDHPLIAFFRKPMLFGRHFSILDTKNHAFKECFRLNRRWKAGVPRPREKARETAKHVPGTFIQTCSAFHGHYAHHFCDIVPRLKLFEDAGLLHKVPALLHVSSTKVSDQSFHALGLDTPESRRWDDTCWTMDGLYFASDHKKFCSWTPESAGYVREKFSPGLDKKPPGNKLYFISRRNAVRATLNEDKILEELKPWGITVVEPEHLSLKEQIELFSDAGLIIGAQGAGIQNSLWAPRGCMVLEFISPRYFSGVYWTLAESLGHHYGLVVGQTTPDVDPVNATSVCDPKLINRALETLARKR